MTVFRFGQVERGDAQRVLRLPERTARVVVSKATEQGFLKSGTPKGPLRAAFPLEYRERLFPNLFGEGQDRAARGAGLADRPLIRPHDAECRVEMDIREVKEISRRGSV
jgi:hypothetical protein